MTKQLNWGFIRPVYWNEYKTKIESRILNDQNPTRFYLDASFLTFENTDNGSN